MAVFGNCGAWIWPRYNNVLFAYLCRTCLAKENLCCLAFAGHLPTPPSPFFRGACKVNILPWRKRQLRCQKFQTDGKASKRAEIFQQLCHAMRLPRVYLSVSDVLLVSLQLCLSVLPVSPPPPLHSPLRSLTWHVVSCYAICPMTCAEFCVPKKHKRNWTSCIVVVVMSEEDTQIELLAEFSALWEVFNAPHWGGGTPKKKPEDWRALMQLRAEINLYGVYSAPVVLPQL